MTSTAYAISSLVKEPQLAGKKAGMVVFSTYPFDPRPRRIIDALTSEGMKVDLICEGEKNAPKRESLPNLEITRIPVRHRRGGVLSYVYQYAAFILLSAVMLAWRALRDGYDLVYVHNMPDILILAAIIPKLFGAKVILDQHDPMPELIRSIFNVNEESIGTRILRRMEKWSIARADLVITVNLACKRIFSERSCHVDKIRVVMNSPDEGIFRYRSARSYPTREPKQPFIIMYHGSLVERNGLELAIDALTLLHEIIPFAELRVYGRRTAYLDQVINKACNVGIENKVQYLGPRKLEELICEIENADVGIIPNQRNSFTDINTPTRIFEYLALGKPVIAPSTQGIQDYFAPDTLLFFQPGDAKSLANQLEYAAFNPPETLAIAERGQQVYLDHRWQLEQENLVSLVAALVQS
jgi:glycosyltransferase involved in cell wall biosynthesis